ncbi:hypothetical protein PQX77_018087 [Marasmius sp. AFHP31]|nr:hypothetical protein PQX77_018087 [Marasmius sp. AFHP31]
MLIRSVQEHMIPALIIWFERVLKEEKIGGILGRGGERIANVEGEGFGPQGGNSNLNTSGIFDVEKPKYAFNHQSVKTQPYQDYFNSDREIESQLLDIPQTKAGIKARKPQVPVNVTSLPQETQIQDESQPFTAPIAIKRTAENIVEARPKKKTKISLAPPIDLAEYLANSFC